MTAHLKPASHLFGDFGQTWKQPCTSAQFTKIILTKSKRRISHTNTLRTYAMMKLMIASLSLIAAYAAPADTASQGEQCKMSKLCCGNEVCNNDCTWRSECEDYPDVGQSMPFNISTPICESFYEYTCCREANGCGDPVSDREG